MFLAIFISCSYNYNMENILKFNKYHFVGIGGISMSALALLLHKMGKIVSGSDVKCTKLQELKKNGIKTFVGFDKKHIKDCDIVIYNYAVQNNNPEIEYAKEKKLLVIDRATFLGYFANLFSKTISVAGTHGKTTTTAMISCGLLRAGMMPTVHIGGDYKLINGNCYLGANKFFVTEACEFRESFLSLNSYIGIITNIEEEHLDYYKNKNNLIRAFQKFANNCANLIVNYNIKCYFKKAITFGINNGDYCAKNLKNKKGNYTFDLYIYGEYICKIALKVGGKFNVLNALACVACCDYLGIDKKRIINALMMFENVDRRFEVLGNINGVDIIQDYAHHPTEIKNSIKLAIQKYGNVYCVFQPHTYSRTKTLFSKFVSCFSCLNHLAILPTYASRENYDYDGSAEALVKAINKDNCRVMTNYTNLKKWLEEAKEGCILFVGAGNIIEVAKKYYFQANKKIKKSN